MIADIRAIPLTPALSDDALSALTRIYVSVYNMIAGDGTDDEYGDRKVYEKGLDCLYDLCRERGNRMADALHRLLRHPMRPTDPAKLEACAVCGEPLEAADDSAGEASLSDLVARIRFTTEDSRTLAQLYDRQLTADAPADPAAMDILVRLAEAQLAMLPQPSLNVATCASCDGGTSADVTRLWLLSVLIDRACSQASSALQDEYFAHSA